MVFEGRGSIGRSGKFDNSTLVWEIVRLRQEKAELLGFENFADLNLQRSMVGNGNRALGFVEDLHERIIDAFRNECLQIESYKARKTGKEVNRLEPWEVSYWAEKQRKEQYDFDDEDSSEVAEDDDVLYYGDDTDPLPVETLFNRRERLDVKKPGPFYTNSPNNFFLDKVSCTK